MTSFPKTGQLPKVARRLKRVAQKARETAEMRAVRRRDRRCRFPLCGCAKFGLPLDCSHQQHRGSGGNPRGDRTDRRTTVLVCRHRHRIGRVSLDKGTLRWKASTKAGADGPIAWWGDCKVLGIPPEVGEIELASEVRPGQLAPLERWQQTLLEDLATLHTKCGIGGF